MPEETKKLEEVDGAKEFSEKLKKCEAEKEDYLNGWKRARADFINYQKDEAKRFEDVIKFSNWDLIRDLITVLDSFAAFERSLEGEPRPNGKLGRDLAGMFIIRNQLEDTLKKRGLERIMISVGQPFDPAFHEAISEVESDAQPGTIAEEVEKGYLLNGRVIRPARVKIAKCQK